MSITRRGFLSSIIACAAAPAIVRASSLMPVAISKQEIWTPRSINEMIIQAWDAAKIADETIVGIISKKTTLWTGGSLYVYESERRSVTLSEIKMIDGRTFRIFEKGERC